MEAEGRPASSLRALDGWVPGLKLFLAFLRKFSCSRDEAEDIKAEEELTKS